MSEHDAPTWTGNCPDCSKPVSAGKRRCAKCLVRLLRDEHGADCACGTCARARGEERIERAEVV